MSRALSISVRRFSRLPEQVKPIALQRLAAHHFAKVRQAARSFTETNAGGTPTGGNKDKTTLSNTNPEQDKKKQQQIDEKIVEEIIQRVLPSIQKSQQIDKHMLQRVLPSIQKPERTWLLWVQTFSVLGTFLLLIGVWYKIYYIKTQEKQAEIKTQFQATSQAISKEAELIKNERAKFYRAATNLRLINGFLLKTWVGLKQNVPLKVGTQTSIILAPDKKAEDTNESKNEDKQQSQSVGELTASAETQKSTQQAPTQTEVNIDPKLRELNLEPLDFGPFVYRVLSQFNDGFFLIDGMKGCGKSTSMLLLCSHLIQQGRAAVYLKLSSRKEDQSPESRFVEEYLMFNPMRFRRVSRHFQRRGGITFVLDDFHQYMVKDKMKENAELTLNTLWDANTLFGARVIFTTSDYGLKKAILSCPGRGSTRIQEIRIQPPAVPDLTRLINEAIVARNEVKREGNSDEDIAMYCEIVGTFRDVMINYILNPSDTCSVRDATVTAFTNCLGKMAIKIGKAAGDDILTNADKLNWTRNCTGWFVSKHSPQCAPTNTKWGVVNWRTEQVQHILEALAEEQMTTASDHDETVLLDEMETLHIVRHVAERTSIWDFHSSVEEVAIRVLLKKPVKEGKQGRGSEKALAYLKKHIYGFEAAQMKMVERLKPTSN